MNTRHILSSLTRLVVAAVCVLTASGCGSELLRTGRAPVILVIDNLEASRGSDPTTFLSSLLSDVSTLVPVTIDGVEVRVPTTFNDLGRATLSLVAKDQSGAVPGGVSPATSPLNSVTITRYRVTFRRADGQNTPGEDVPFGFDGALTQTVSVGGTGGVIFDLVRHAAKAEPPLRNLTGAGGLRFITTVAEVTFFGRDQNGNEVTATGMMDVTFADFGD